MVIYHMDDGTIVDTDNAVNSWAEDTSWDGHNRLSEIAGVPWIHRTLYENSEGRYYLESVSRWQGSPSTKWVSHKDAASWLLANAYAIPEELAQVDDKVAE